MPNGKKVRHALVERDMTQADLARKSGISPEHISGIIRTDKNVRESTLKRICKAIGCNAEEIW